MYQAHGQRAASLAKAVMLQPAKAGIKIKGLGQYKGL